MSIAVPEPMGSELTISRQQSNFSPAQRVALGHMGVDQAPDADVQVFFHVCQRTRLDPFARQIYMIGRRESQLIDGQWQKVMKYTIQTGIDGFRLVARRVADETGDELAYEDTMWCGRDGQWRDVWLGDPVDLYAAKATVVRKGARFTHVALYREYVQTKTNGDPNTMWATKGANQLAKCAEAGALRKAFPQDLGGMYVDAEMEHQASEAAAASVVQGGRDWWADADAAADVDALAALWSEAHLAHQLGAALRDHIQARKAALVAAASASDDDVQDTEEIDQQTGEVTPPKPTPAKPATLNAIARELGRCGVERGTADAYLPALGIPKPLAELTQNEAAELLVACRSLTRDTLVELMAEANGSER